jgi:hypothetical protein
MTTSNFYLGWSGSALLAVILALGLSAPASKAVGEQLILVDNVYCPLFCDSEEKPGIYVELLKPILQAEGHQLITKILPFKRAMHFVLASNHRPSPMYLLVGGSSEFSNELIESKPIFYQEACFYTSKDSDWHYTGMDSPAARFGVVDLYDYSFFSDFLNRANDPHELVTVVGSSPTETVLKMMAAKRINALVDLRSHTDVLIKELKLEDLIINAGCDSRPFPLKIYFPRHHPLVLKLLKIIEEGVEKGNRDGSIEVLFERYDAPYLPPVIAKP